MHIAGSGLLVTSLAPGRAMEVESRAWSSTTLCTNFLADKAETGQVFLPYLQVSPVGVTPTVLHAHPSTTDATCS